MAARARGSIYDQTVSITHRYLGPAASRFIDRQVHNHLHKEPEAITEKDLSTLIRWVRLAVSVLSDDSQLVEDYIGQLERLARDSRPRKP